MQIIHLGFLVILPCRTGEAGAPVIRFLSILAFPPEIVIPIRIFSGFPAFYKPGMFIGGVINHQVHNNFNAMGMCRCQHPVKILHGSKILHNSLIIADVVSIVIIGRFINRRKPDYINAQLL